MSATSAISARVLRVLGLVQRLEPEERSQLAQLLPPELVASTSVSGPALTEAVAYFRAKASDRTPPSLDDPFIGDLTYREYFALSENEADMLWAELDAEAPVLEELPVIDVQPDAQLPSRQERRP